MTTTMAGYAKIKEMAGAAASGEAVEEIATTKLYRAVSVEEYESIIESGRFSSGGALTMEDKWFATSLENAKKWG